jgi:PAS domain S-box-containing protein
MRLLVAQMDWASSAFGEREAWPPQLSSMIEVVLTSRFPMFLLWGAERLMIYNDAYVPILGTLHPAALGRPFFEVWPDVGAEVGASIDKAFSGEASYFENLPVTVQRFGFEERAWFTFSYSPVHGAPGRIEGALCVCAETSATIRVANRQAFLAALEARLRPLTDAQQIIGVAQEELGRHLQASRVGYGAVDPTERYFTTANNWTDGTVPNHAGVHDLAAFGEDVHAAIRRGEVLALHNVRDDRLPLSGKALAAFEQLQIRAVVTVSLVKDERMVAALYVHQQTPRHWDEDEIATISEVAERTWAAVERARAEEELRALNEMLEVRVAERTAERDRLWALSEDMLAHANYDGMLSAVSPAWTRVLGWTEAELLTRPYASFMHPEDMEATLAALSRMGESGQPARFENRIATRDGSWTPVEWTVVPEPDSANFIAVGRDLSASKMREAELATAREALRQSQKMEAMGQLTGGVAHDFNNLLTPIVGSLDMLQRNGVGNERERKLIAGAMQSAERAKTLVQRLLAFARRQPLQPGPVDVGKLISGMAELVSRTTGPQINVVSVAPEDLPPAEADQNQLEMALLNLGVNARDAMPDGGTLRITAEAKTVGAEHRTKLKPGTYVKLSVADTGIGMDEATLGRAVEPFFSTKGIGKGTGLGLSMVHGLASQLGGALQIASRPGMGTNVELWLPISSAPTESPQNGAIADPPKADAGTALLVDDEDLVRMSTAAILTDLGYGVVEAASAETALALIDGGLKPDLLVSDHLMPGMNGTDLARAIRARGEDVKVLIVSGYADNEGLSSDFPRLNKPFRADEMAASLASLRSG